MERFCVQTKEGINKKNRVITFAISGEVTPGAILTKCGMWAARILLSDISLLSCSRSKTRTVLTRRVSSYGLPAALSDYGVNAAGIAEIVIIFRNDSSLAEMPGSFA